MFGMLTFDQAALLGTMVVSALAAAFGGRFIPGERKPPAISPLMAIAGGALADTLGLQANTEAILRLAESNETLAKARMYGNDIARQQSKIGQEIIDALIEMRRAVEEAASAAANLADQKRRQERT